jgi:hypothetical protein
MQSSWDLALVLSSIQEHGEADTRLLPLPPDFRFAEQTRKTDFFDFKNQSFINWLATIHQLFGKLVMNLFRKSFLSN